MSWGKRDSSSHLRAETRARVVKSAPLRALTSLTACWASFEPKGKELLKGSTPLPPKEIGSFLLFYLKLSDNGLSLELLSNQLLEIEDTGRDILVLGNNGIDLLGNVAINYGEFFKVGIDIGVGNYILYERA